MWVLSSESTSPVTVYYTIGSDSNENEATKDDDYSVPSAGGSLPSGVDGSLTFPANNSTPQPITINVTRDALYEENEMVTVTFSLPTLATPVAELPVNPVVTGTYN